MKEPTSDFRLLHMGFSPSRIVVMLGETRKLSRLVKDVISIDLSSPLKEIIEDLEQFEKVLSEDRWDDTDIGKCVDSLRDRFTSFVKLVLDIERR